MKAIVYRPVTGRLRLRMPYSRGNRFWLNDLGIRPDWNRERSCWEVSRVHFDAVLKAVSLRHNCAVYVVVEGWQGERCDVRCQEARGTECVCCCGGAHHGGMQSEAWQRKGDTRLMRGRRVETTFIYDARRPKGPTRSRQPKETTA